MSMAFENQAVASSDEESDTNSIESTKDYKEKHQPPKKLKYLWKCFTYPIRLYRRFEWWSIEKFLATKTMQKDKVTLRLHHKYRDNVKLCLLYHFHDIALATKGLERDKIKLDMEQVKGLLESGADPHATDDIGQNLMHEIARYHTEEVCLFFLKYEVNINLEDDYSVTPLHVSAAYNNSDVVEVLVTNGGELEATTFYMLQTPLHYAARYDSPSSVKKLVEMGANIEARDYRGRTPLLLAAELGRVSAGAMLLECGARVYAIDFTGMYGLSSMVGKCPPLAIKALDTCVKDDLRNRKQYLYLHFLEPRTLCNDECAKITFTVLEEAVRAGDLEIIQHKAVQTIIDVKWNQFGKRGYAKELIAYIMVLINWSLLCILNPLDNTKASSKVDSVVEIIALINEVLTGLFFFYQVFDEIRELRTNIRRHKKCVAQRDAQLEMEFKYLELLSAEEKEYLRKEQEGVRRSESHYTRDLWNAFDWLSIILTFVTYIVHLTTKYVPLPHARTTSAQLLSVTVIMVWLKLFKYVRVLKTLGPFSVIIATLPKDFIKIAMVYVILYVPMVCVFFHFFAGPYDEKLVASDDFNKNKYENFENTCFTVFLYTLVDDYGYDTLIKLSGERGVDRWFTQSLIAYWVIVSAVLLLNIFIAVMSDTFSRVYENALAVAQYERAAMIVSIENKLPSYWRKYHLIDIGNNYAPCIVFFDDDDVPDDDEETFEESVIDAHKKLTQIQKAMKDRQSEALIDFVKRKIRAQNDIIVQIIDLIDDLKTKSEIAAASRTSPKK